MTDDARPSEDRLRAHLRSTSRVAHHAIHDDRRDGTWEVCEHEPCVGDRAALAASRPAPDTRTSWCFVHGRYDQCENAPLPDTRTEALDDPLRILGALAHVGSRDHEDKDDCVVCVAARPVLAALSHK